MNLDRPALDRRDDDYEFSADPRLNALCNRVARQAGPRETDEICVLAMLAVTPRGWAEGFLGLAATARAEGRHFAADCYARAAESLVAPVSPRRTPTLTA
ncbi:MAG TPA: hypothetical protein VK817_18290 [Trebonia sp.]|jgi:hypothetical protein|nr:hypothetical protein [Trebonia sp.]